MRRTVLVVLLAALAVLSGCSRAGTAGPAAKPTTPSATTPATDAAARVAAIYAATLRRFLTTADSSAGQPQRWQRAYVLTRPQPRPADQDGALPSLPATVQQAVTDALRDVVAVTWVADRSAVLPRQGCPKLLSGTILVTLGPVPEAGDRVEVPIFGLVACLNASGLTYILRHTSGGWQVTGSTGPYVIS